MKPERHDEIEHDTAEEAGKAFRVPVKDKIVREPKESKAHQRREELKEKIQNKNVWLDPENPVIWDGDAEE